MVGVDGQISSDAVHHLGVVESQHVREVTSPIERVVGLDEISTVIFVTIDGGADVGQLGKKIHGVLIVVLPELSLIGSLLVGIEERAVSLEVEEGHGEHGHGVEVLGQAGDEVDVSFAEVASSLPFLREVIEFFLRRVSSSGQEEEHGFGKRF